MLAGGIRLVLRGVGPRPGTVLISEVERCSLSKAFSIYCVVQVLSSALRFVGEMMPGLWQAMLALANFRWIFFFVVAVIVFVQKRGYAAVDVGGCLRDFTGFLVFLCGL